MKAKARHREGSYPVTLLLTLQKSRKSPRLIPKKMMVTRGNTNYMTTVWVLPEGASGSSSHVAQFDLFAEQQVDEMESRNRFVAHLPIGTSIQYFVKGENRTGEIAKIGKNAVLLADGSKIAVSDIKVVLPEHEPERIHEAIAHAAPGRRAAITAAMFGAEVDDNNLQPEPEYDFVPDVAMQHDGEVTDYRKVVPLKISPVSEKGILNRPRPSWIPELSDRRFSAVHNRIEGVKLGPNDYVVLLDATQGAKRYARVTVDVLAAMQDYYLKRAKALNAMEQKTRMVKLKPVRVLPITKVTVGNINLATTWLGKDRQACLAAVNMALDDMRQKLSDMNMQLEENLSVYAKGEETSYGDKGINADLLDQYGVFVKRQNGDPITRQEVAEIRHALDDVFSVYGDRSEMSRKFGLKISHSGHVLMHARKVAGIYFPMYHTIGVTMKAGPEGFGFTLAHEWAHFMDNYLGLKSHKYMYSSDDWNSLSGQIAQSFRRHMRKRQSSEYMNRTCECFARAFEQYFATKQGDPEEFQKTNNGQGNYCSQEVFEKEIQGLIDTWFKENDALLKSLRVTK